MDPITLKKARRHLQRSDAILKGLIKTVGDCTLRHDPDHFAVLTRSIISQQISTAAARTITARFLAKIERFQPKNVLAATDEEMREAGLSQSKRLALRDLAEKCGDGTVPLRKLAALDEEAVIETLIQVRGIGRWTAEMFLIFSLGRLDVLPVGDLGLRAGIRNHYALAELPTKDTMIELAQMWQPYRSVATWYLWRSFGNVPQSDKK